MDNGKDMVWVPNVGLVPKTQAPWIPEGKTELERLRWTTINLGAAHYQLSSNYAILAEQCIKHKNEIEKLKSEIDSLNYMITREGIETEAM